MEELHRARPEVRVVEERRHRPFEMTGKVGQLGDERLQAAWVLPELKGCLVLDGAKALFAGKVEDLSELRIDRRPNPLREGHPGYE